MGATVRDAPPASGAPRRALRARRVLRKDESANLMLIAGIVITIAFLMTALTLSEVSSLEKQAAGQKTSNIEAEWRFLHDRVATNLRSAVTPELTNDTLNATTFPAVVATFRGIEAEKGYDTIIRLAGDGPYNKTEFDLINQTMRTYDVNASDGTHYFNQAPDFYNLADRHDGHNDGILWQKPCPDSSGPAAGCIGGLLVFLHMTDSTSTMDEVVLFAVNQ